MYRLHTFARGDSITHGMGVAEISIWWSHDRRSGLTGVHVASGIVSYFTSLSLSLGPLPFSHEGGDGDGLFHNILFHAQYDIKKRARFRDI